MNNIKDFLAYDGETGVFTWLKQHPNRSVKANTLAGWKDKKGYIRINYLNKSYGAHRLAWYFVYGYMPKESIDHINEVKDDNRICNLREATNAENRQNISAPYKNNTSGYKGVYWRKDRNTWIAIIVHNRKNISIGSFKTPEEAHKAYLAKKRELHPFWSEHES